MIRKNCFRVDVGGDGLVFAAVVEGEAIEA
jgi:hypothetical protein